MRVEIWSDVVCPWCYIGKRRFEAALTQFEHRADVEIRWRSFELDPGAPAERSGDMAEHLAAKYGMSVADAHARLESLDQLAAADGLQYNLAKTRGGNTFAAHRLIHLGYERGADSGAAVKEALLRAYFIDLEPIGDPEVLTEIGVGAGLDREEIGALLASERFAADVRADEAEAVELGCSGVPFFVFDRTFAVAGAQDVDTFLLTLRRTWSRSHPLEAVGSGDGVACGEEGCAV